MRKAIKHAETYLLLPTISLAWIALTVGGSKAACKSELKMVETRYS